jgi:DNA-binding transcriptional LysR family regulator
MTLKQLEVFLAVADTGSFSKGGEAVSLAQSTASQHIRALEEELGARLFDRNVSQVRLTEAGRLFYRHAALICSHCSEAKKEVGRFLGLEQASLRIGASTIPAVYLIPELLGRLTQAWPGIKLELKQGDSQEVIRLLRESQVELGVVGGRFDADDICFRELLEDGIVLVGLPGLMGNEALSVHQLQGIPLIMREQGSGTRQAIETALQKADVNLRSLRVVAELGSSEAVLRAVLCGAGSAFVSRFAVSRELGDGSLVENQLSGLDIKRSFYLAQRKWGTLSPAADAMLQVMGSMYPETGSKS